MAESEKIMDAVVELHTDPTHFAHGLSEALEMATKFVEKGEGIFAGLSKFVIPAGVALAVGALAHAAMEGAEHVEHLSAEIGLSVEDLTRLQYVGKRVNLSIDDMATGVKFLSRQMVKGEDDIGKASKALDRLGISSRDATGKIRPTIDVLLDVSDKFSRMENGATKTATAVELFGRGGIQMIPLLNLGREAIDEMARASDRLGITLSTRTAEASADFLASMRLMAMQVKGAANEFISGLAPVLSAITTQLETGLTPAVKDAHKHLSVFGHELADDADPIAERWQEAGKAIGTVATILIMDLKAVAATAKLAIEAILHIGAMSVTGRSFGEGAKTLKNDWDTFGKTLDTVGDEGAAAIDKLFNSTKKLEGGTTDAAEDTIKKANRALELAIIGKKQDIAGANDNTAAEEMYAQALDKVGYYTAVESGASETLAKILMDLSAQARAATRAQKEREEQAKDAAAAEREREKDERRRFNEEGKLYAGRYRAAHEAINKTFDEETKLNNFMLESRHNVAQSTLTDFQREVYEAKLRYDKEMEFAAENFNDEQNFNTAREQAQLELSQSLRSINQRYADDIVSIMRRMIDDTLTNQQRLRAALIQFGTDTLGDVQHTMSDVFFDAMTGKFHDLDDVAKAFFTSFKHHIADFLADQLTKKLIEFIINLALAHGMGGGSTTTAGGGYIGGSMTSHFAGGGVIRGGVESFAGGAVVSQPRLFQAGEGGMSEAIVPMPNGKIPVELKGGDSHGTLALQQRIVIAPEILASMRTSPDEIVNVISQDMARGGRTYQIVKQFVMKR